MLLQSLAGGLSLTTGTPINRSITTMWSFHCGSAVNKHDQYPGLIPGPTQWMKDLALPSAAVQITDRHGLDLALLWLWHRPAAAAPIQPLVWKLPCATGAALKKKPTIIHHYIPN